MAVLPVGIGPVTGYNIERSLRFNSADSAYLNRTPASAGNRKTWTWSGWVKRSALSAGGYQNIFQCNSATTNDNNYFSFRFMTGNEIGVVLYSYFPLISTQVLRDFSAWYHFVLSVDTTQATASNRIRLYINGIEVTSWGTDNRSSISQNSDLAINLASQHNIGSYQGSSEYFSGYMTEVNFIDGQALTPSSFGETDPNTGVWRPKKYTGTYGTNGFYLNFADNSGTTSTTLGKDSSGNGNNWTPNNFSVTAGAGNDSLVDTPTPYGSDTGAGGEVRGNYCVISPINSNATILNGGLDVNKATSGQSKNIATISSNFKTYFEVTFNGQTGTNNVYMGVGSKPSVNDYNATNALGYDSFAWAVGTNNTAVYKYNNNSLTQLASGASSANDIFMIAYDPPNGKIWFGKNGTWYASGDPAAGTNAAFTNLAAEVFPVIDVNGVSGSITVNCNFGQRPFAYTAPSGFKALCTTNLPTPTIGATSTTQANKYFDVLTYTGDGTTSRTFSGRAFAPEFIWNKSRSDAYNHRIHDVVRGTNKTLFSSTTDAEVNDYSVYGEVTAFNSDGYTISTGGTAGNFIANINNKSYVSWLWKANGAGSTNTAGTITSTVSANTTAGFSIVTYTGTGSNATVGHGLGVAPSLVIVKQRTTSSSTDWAVQHRSLLATQVLLLNTTDAAITASTFQNTYASSTVFSIAGISSATNTNNGTYVAYCFAPVAGYSAFGSYTGNGSADGPFVFLGFRPAYVFIKRTDSTGDWAVYDTKRNPYNVMFNPLRLNTSGAEDSNGIADNSIDLDCLSNGFKLRDGGAGSGAPINANGGSYIYAAFAEVPAKYSLAR